MSCLSTSLAFQSELELIGWNMCRNGFVSCERELTGDHVKTLSNTLAAVASRSTAVADEAQLQTKRRGREKKEGKGPPSLWPWAPRSRSTIASWWAHQDYSAGGDIQRVPLPEWNGAGRNQWSAGLTAVYYSVKQLVVGRRSNASSLAVLDGQQADKSPNCWCDTWGKDGATGVATYQDGAALWLIAGHSRRSKEYPSRDKQLLLP